MPGKSLEELRKGLKRRHWRFIEELVMCGDPKEAAIAAGYAPGSALGQSTRLLKNATICFAYALRLKEANATSPAKREELVDHLLTIVRADPGELVEWGNGTVTFEESKKLSIRQRRFVQSVSKSKEGMKIRFYSRLDAMEKLAKIHGWYKDSEDAASTADVIRAIFADKRPVHIIPGNTTSPLDRPGKDADASNRRTAKDADKHPGRRKPTRSKRTGKPAGKRKPRRTASE